MIQETLHIPTPDVQAILGDRSITEALYRVKRFNEYDEPSSSSVEVMRSLQRDADADRGWFQRHFNPTAIRESLEEASQPNLVERLVTEHPLIALIPVESMFKSVQTAGAVALRSATSAAKAIPYVGAVVIGVEVANEVCKGLTGEGLYENLINYAKGGKDAVGKSRSSGLGSGPGRVTPKYGKGEYWDKLVTDKASAGKAGIKPKDVGTILGKIQRAKRQIGGDIRADAQGNLYKFDPAHKSSKVHLERIEEREGKFVGTGEVDPVTGKVAPLKDGWRKY